MSESKDTFPRFPKNGPTEVLAFTYNDCIADTILRLETVKKEIEELTARLRVAHNEMGHLPEIYELELKQVKRNYGLENRTQVT